MDRSLWEASGHWAQFGENMYTTRTPDDRVYAIKPMNCPGHVQIFKQGIRSYHQLPHPLSRNSARCIATSPPARCTA